jgi:hypothetical protein
MFISNGHRAAVIALRKQMEKYKTQLGFADDVDAVQTVGEVVASPLAPEADEDQGATAESHKGIAKVPTPDHPEYSKNNDPVPVTPRQPIHGTGLNIEVNPAYVDQAVRHYDSHLASLKAAHDSFAGILVPSFAFGNTVYAADTCGSWYAMQMETSRLLQGIDVDVSDTQAALLDTGQGFTIADEAAITPMDSAGDAAQQAAESMPMDRIGIASTDGSGG